MSTNANLPAGFSITSIDGQRCTAVPRASTTLTGADATAAAAFTTTSTTTAAAAALTTASAQVQPNVVVGGGAGPVTSVSVAAVTPVASTTTSSAAFISTSTTQAAVVSAAALPASKGTTPTTSSSTVLAVAQSDLHASPTIVSGNGIGSGLQAPSKTFLNSSPASTSDQTQSQASVGTSSGSKPSAAPVVGGVVGAMGLIAVLFLLFWAFRRRRKTGRESLLTPLTTGRQSEYYDDKASVGPSSRRKKWRSGVGYQTNKIKAVISGMGAGLTGIGASLKSKVAGDRSDTPSVNLNRGNSQFLDGPIPQHSRNNSVLSNNTGTVSVKDRLTEWWERVGESLSFKWRLRKAKEPADPFAAARGLTEKQANMGTSPDFSQLLGMGDRDLQLRADRRRASMSGTGSVPQIGSLGLNFNMDDPFADPIKGSSQAWKPGKSAANPFADPKFNSNPFADPARPERSIAKANTYISDMRRSRGQSVDATSRGNNTTSTYRPPSTAVDSRYPSTIAPSRDSYRDTVYSSFSANARKGKGRSDPFDLERPELWRPREITDRAAIYPNSLGTAAPPRTSRAGNAYNSKQQQPARVTSTETYGSKYSSGVSSIGDWGEPGPDLGPGSGSSSLRANASSNGGSTDFSADKGAQSSLDEMKQEWDERRGKDNISPQSVESKASSKGGVGKAM